ncbi:MAG: cyclic nucleotide-binding domain-containing protein [Acidimicrobiia bacterium]
MARRDVFLDHLQGVALFAGCSRKDLQRVARKAESRRVVAGTAIVNEGENGSEFFVVIDGTARVSRQGRKVATVGPGSGFGELALLAKAPRNATVVADTDMELAVVGEREFAELLDEVPGFARRMLRSTAHRLREADVRSIQ